MANPKEPDFKDIRKKMQETNAKIAMDAQVPILPKRCVDCEHCWNTDVPIWHLEYMHTCVRKYEDNVVDGSTRFMGGAVPCSQARTTSMCGPEGKHFKAKEPARPEIIDAVTFKDENRVTHIDFTIKYPKNSKKPLDTS